MDNTTRRRILGLFPPGADEEGSDTCRYINQFTYLPCGHQTRSIAVSACEYHMNDFELWRTVLTQDPTVPVLPTFENWRDIIPGPPMYLNEIQPIVQTSINQTIESFPLLIDANNTCSVCEESINLLSLPCRHVTCLSCYNQLLSKTCPECRSEIITSFIRRV